MIQVLAASAQAASSPAMRVRAGIPAAALQEFEVAVEAVPLFSDREYLSFSTATVLQKGRLVAKARSRFRSTVQGSPASVAWILRRADMLPTRALEERLMLGRRVIYDVDDAIWFDGTQARGHRLAFMKGSKQKARWLAERANQVVAGNEILAEWLADYSPRVSVVPSLVDTHLFAPRHHGDKERITVGWIGSHTTAGYLRRVVGPLEQAARALGEKKLSLLVVGGVAPPVRGVRSVQRPWSEEGEARALESIDIGVMPLPENRWTRGKCAYKAIQYMAAGIPVIADDVGVTSQVVGAGGVVPRSGLEWGDAFVELARNARLRRELGEAGRRRAVDHFSVQRWAPTLARVIRGD